MPVVFAIVGALTYGGTWLVCKIASLFRPSIESFSSYSDGAQSVIVLSFLIGLLPFGFIGANLLIWGIPPLRRFFDLEAEKRAKELLEEGVEERVGARFKKTMRQLLQFSAWTSIPAFFIALLAALFFG
jgi:hypothetical protein